MSTTIFTNKTTNATTTARVLDNGTIQIDVFGVLDGADFKTSYLDNEGNDIMIRDFSWLASKGDVLDATDGDGAIKGVHKRDLKFEIINAGASTDLTVSATHETGSLEILTEV